MLVSSIPSKLNIPWANGASGGYVHTIPQASQISITPGAASLTDGFPPLNFMDPVLAGGIPPSGADMNGILRQITQGLQWLQAGGLPKYDSTFSTAIGGYPNGSVLVNAAGTGFWISTVDNNATNPDASGAGWSAITGGGGGGSYLPLAGGVSMTGQYNLSANATTSMQPITKQQFDAAIAGLSGGSGLVWGGITGTLTAQTDLLTALNAKAALAGSSGQQFAVQAATSGGNAVNLTQMTAAIASSVAFPAANAVGCWMMVQAQDTSSHAVGDTVNASILNYVSNNFTGATVACAGGTWRIMFPVYSYAFPYYSGSGIAQRLT